MADPFRHRLRVRYAECDPQGVVFFTRYLEYLDVAVTELWREALGSYDSMLEEGSDLVVAEVNARYLASARFDDELDLALTITRLGTTGLSLAVAVERDGELLVELGARHVCIDPATKQKKAIPERVREALAPYAGAAVEAASR